MSFKSMRRRLPALAALAMAVGLGACSDILTVDNPGALNDPDLNDPVLISSMVTAGVANFDNEFDDLVFAGAILGDEAVNGHNFEQWKRIDLRLIEADNSIIHSDVYQPLQAARFAADSLAGRITVIYGDTLNDNGRLQIARLRAYGGYSFVMLGEYFCQAPVNLSAGLPSDSLLTRGIADFDQAIALSKTVKANTKATALQKASADSLITLSMIGAARAYLQIGNKAKAIEYAQPVASGTTGFASGFTWWVTYSDNTSNPNDRLFAATTGSSRYLGVDASFRNLTVAGVKDRRVKYNPKPGTGHNALTVLYTPYLAPSHSGFVAAADSQAFSNSTAIRLASTLEAQYIVAEAQGATPATLAFVNQRRAFGANGAPGTDVTLTGDALMAELRDQRRRDFYLDGHRLGDLRRYKAQYNVDQFPSGPHPNTEWGSYGTATCFVPTIAEQIGNPNYTP